MKIKFKKYKIVLNIIISIFLVAGVFVGGVYYGYSKRPEIEKVLSISNNQASLLIGIICIIGVPFGIVPIKFLFNCFAICFLLILPPLMFPSSFSFFALLLF